MSDVSPERPLILIFRPQPPSSPSCSLTTSNHSRTPLRIAPQEKRRERGCSVHQSEGDGHFFPNQRHAGGFYMTPLIRREYVYEPLLLANCLFPIRSPSFETQGLGRAERASLFCRGVVMDGRSAERALLSGGRPYFSFSATARSSRLRERFQGHWPRARAAGPGEEYLIRCNGIRVI